MSNKIKTTQIVQINIKDLQAWVREVTSAFVDKPNNVYLQPKDTSIQIDESFLGNVHLKSCKPKTVREFIDSRFWYHPDHKISFYYIEDAVEFAYIMNKLTGDTFQVVSSDIAMSSE